MKQLLCILICLAVLAPMADAQVEEGDKEIQVLGYFMSMSGISMMTVQFTYGMFIKPNIEIGAGPQITRIDTDFTDPETTLSSSFFGRYYFESTTKYVPYVGGQWFQYDFTPPEGLGFFDYSFIQVGGGVKYFVNEYIAWDVSANYGFGLGSGGDGVFLLMGGLSAFF